MVTRFLWDHSGPLRWLYWREGHIRGRIYRSDAAKFYPEYYDRNGIGTAYGPECPTLEAAQTWVETQIAV